MGFARFAYLDNPFPSLFKERLFVYLSRFCEVRYCIARHVGFLVGLGNPSGDPECLPQTIEQVLPLLRRPLPSGRELETLLTILCSTHNSPFSALPNPDTAEEKALFACATHLFLQTPDAPKAHEALAQTLGLARLERMNVFLAFVRMAHYWTKLHRELAFEKDIQRLLATHAVLAACILGHSASEADLLSVEVAADLNSLQELS